MNFPRPRRDIALRTIVLGMVCGVGLMSALLLLFLAAGQGFQRNPVVLWLILSVEGLVIGALLAAISLLVLLPLAMWASEAVGRCRALGAAALPAPLTVIVLIDPRLLPQVLTLPLLVLLAAIGVWRGPDLIRLP